MVGQIQALAPVLIGAMVMVPLTALASWVYELALAVTAPSLKKSGPNAKPPSIDVAREIIRRRLRVVVWYPLFFLFLAGLLFVVMPPIIEGHSNITTGKGVLGPASPEAVALHEELRVVDMHTDSLLWSYRDLLTKYPSGQVDIPRMVEGNIHLQMFTIVTKVPLYMNFYSNANDTTDMITAMAALQRWPLATFTSLLERALFQARNLRTYAAESEGSFVFVSNRKDLASYLEHRANNRGVTAGLLGVEGTHCAEGRVENLDRLFQAGVRMAGITHFFDNQLGGSAHGVEKGGLTALGRRMVERMEELGILIDIAHASDAVIADVTAMARRPVVSSHTGVKGTCDNVRNLSDDQLRAVAKTGGLVSIAFFDQAICDGVPGIVRALRHAVDVAGLYHVAIGSDWDGGVSTPFPVDEMAVLTDALLGAGFSEPEIRRVMGENVLDLLLRALPESDRLPSTTGHPAPVAPRQADPIETVNLPYYPDPSEDLEEHVA